MTEIKTPYDFSLGGKDKNYAVKASKCSTHVEEAIYWFNEYLTLVLDTITKDKDAMREQEWRIPAHSIPENLYQLVAFTWLKFDYFCHTQENNDLPEGLFDPEVSPLDTEVICLHTDIKSESYNFDYSYFQKLLSYVKQSNYLAICFAEAGWDLRTKRLCAGNIEYVLSWRTPDKAEERVKMLPKKVDNYTKSTIVEVLDSKVKEKLGFDRRELINWFNTELDNFYGTLTKVETLKYALDKEFKVNYHRIPAKYYKIVTDKPYPASKYSKYIVFTKQFVDILEENHWFIDLQSRDISGRFSEPELIKFVYEGE